MYTIRGSTLRIEEKEIIFEFPIADHIKIGDMLILYLDFFDELIPIDNNVYGVSLSERKIKWQVEKRKYPTGGYTGRRCPFVGISLNENKLRLHNWCSTDLIVEPTTGIVLEVLETR